MTPVSDNLIRFNLGVPQVFCPKFIEGKSVRSDYDDGRQMFTAIDGRKAFVNDDDARALVDGMRRFGIRPGEDFIRVTKQKTRQGAPFLYVERVADPPDEPGTISAPRIPPQSQPPAPPRAQAVNATPPSPLETQLEGSIRAVHTHGPDIFKRNAHVVSPDPQPAPTGEPPKSGLSDRARRFAACLADAIAAYAQVEPAARPVVDENIRATAITFFIQDCQDSRYVGGAR